MRKAGMSFGAVVLLSIPACNVGSSSDAGDDGAPNGQSQAELDGCYPNGGGLNQYGVCLCKDLGKVGTLELLEGPNGIATSIGVNGRSALVAAAHVEGSWNAYGGLSAVQETSIAGDLITSKDVTWVGDLSIGQDLDAGGTVHGVGTLSVGGNLRAANPAQVVGTQKIGAVGSYTASSAPCACDGASFFDVAGAVAQAAKVNDNATIKLPTDITSIGTTKITLPSGRYYIDPGARTVGDVTFDIEGKVALFVASSMAAVGGEQFKLGSGASLDLYIAGSLASVGNLAFGDAASQSVRIFVGGPDAVMLHVGNQVFHGQIYAPTAPIAYVGNTEVDGALFARELAGVGNLIVRYGGAVATPPDTCIPNDGNNPSGGSNNDVPR